MTERLLQHIWQFQIFNRSSLLSIEEEQVQIIHPGNFNHNQGPDFLAAKIRVAKTIWVGSIELHINSSDWKNHKHTADKNYNNVILHVVWHHDVDLKLPFPTLLLQDRVSTMLLAKYEELMHSPLFIPCEKNIKLVSNIILQSWKERLLVERLQTKTQVIFLYLEKSKNHWDETFWWLIAKNFGAKVNSDAFCAMAQSIPITLLAKHKNQIHQVEAFLFGQAGLLEGSFTEAYPKSLQKEYAFLKTKYKLRKTHHNMMFRLMRPSNFPTIRLAQLAMLIHKSEHLFSKIKETYSLKEIKALLQLTANDYWHYHYIFDEQTAFKKKNLGKLMINNILINTVIPVLFAYGLHQKEDKFKNKALQWLEEIKAEVNSITTGFAQLGIPCKTAFDSQALIQLKNEYCNKKRCLDCSIGNKLLAISP